mgnify:CR=1 FL=1
MKTTTHDLAQELLSKEDNFVTVTIGHREYMIDGIKKVKTHANLDDSMCYWTFECHEEK